MANALVEFGSRTGAIGCIRGAIGLISSEAARWRVARRALRLSGLRSPCCNGLQLGPDIVQQRLASHTEFKVREVRQVPQLQVLQPTWHEIEGVSDNIVRSAVPDVSLRDVR